MKRVKTVKQLDVRQSLLLAGLILASAGAQAGTITTGNGFVDRIDAVRSISLLTPIEVDSRAGRILIANPGPLIPSPAASLNAASAWSSVSGSMNYSVGSNYGNFSESNSSVDGSVVELELGRKGYAYRAEASVETGQAKARAETKWVSSNGNGYGYNYGSSSANATSTWSDWFVISGGTGLGTASFASMLDGTLTSSKNGSAGYSLNIGYSSSAHCDGWYSSCSEADQPQTLFSQISSLSGRGKSTLSQNIESEFTFAYDRAFQLTALLNVGATNGGMADFTLGTNSLILPQGASLLSSSSGMYVQAVPEAETYAMMLAGLGLVGWAAMRRRAKSK